MNNSPVIRHMANMNIHLIPLKTLSLPMHFTALRDAVKSGESVNKVKRKEIKRKLLRGKSRSVVSVATGWTRKNIV